MDSRALAEAFAGLLRNHSAVQVLRERTPYDDEIDQCVALGVPMLRALWDCYDGCNAPLGFSDVAIHTALNLLGDGEYCAV